MASVDSLFELMAKLFLLWFTVMSVSVAVAAVFSEIVLKVLCKILAYL